MRIDIGISHDISCMDIAYLGGGNQGKVLACGEKMDGNFTICK